uniref:WAP domain-containing protein n=1 Tax=Trichuris muris TaxID=70415 RepID=A0A5S6QWD0_TRIMR
MANKLLLVWSCLIISISAIEEETKLSNLTEFQLIPPPKPPRTFTYKGPTTELDAVDKPLAPQHFDVTVPSNTSVPAKTPDKSVSKGNANKKVTAIARCFKNSCKAVKKCVGDYCTRSKTGKKVEH